MVKFVTIALLYTSALVAQTMALTMSQENSAEVFIFLFSVTIISIQMYSSYYGRVKLEADSEVKLSL